MTILSFKPPPETSHNRAMEIISEYMLIAHQQRAKVQQDFEDMMLSREMPVEIAFKAAILNKKL